jgi:hypothetical protein
LRFLSRKCTFRLGFGRRKDGVVFGSRCDPDGIDALLSISEGMYQEVVVPFAPSTLMHHLHSRLGVVSNAANVHCDERLTAAIAGLRSSRAGRASHHEGTCSHDFAQP